jgi:hypothetical protein
MLVVPTENLAGQRFFFVLHCGINFADRQDRGPGSEPAATSPARPSSHPATARMAPLVDESTRMTIGKMGGILRVSTTAGKSFPTLIAINRFMLIQAS